MLRLIRLLIKNGAMRQLAYPMSVWIDFFVGFVWLGLFVAVVFILMAHTGSIRGWGSAELLLLLGVWSLIDDLHWGFVGPNLASFSDMVNRGEFDQIITKPANTQLIATLQKVNLGRLLVSTADIILIFVALKIGAFHPTFTSFLFAAILIACGLVITYSIALLIQTLSFWLVRVENLWAMYEGTSWILKYPLDIFGPLVKAISLTIVPFGVAIAFPAQALAGTLAWPWVIYAIAIALLFFFLSRWFFNFALRHYTSASS